MGRRQGFVIAANAATVAAATAASAAAAANAADAPRTLARWAAPGNTTGGEVVLLSLCE